MARRGSATQGKVFTMRPPTMAALSADSIALIDALRGVKIGDVITYEHLNAVISGDVQKRQRSALLTARRRLVREDRIVFDVVRGVGLRRLSNAETANVLPSCTRRLRRAAGRARRIGECVSVLELEPSDRAKLVARMTQLQLVAEITTSTAEKRVEVAAAGATAPLAAEQAWKALRGRDQK
jgi:hypothetical protein